MQRRSAAVYFVLFIVLGAGAYGFIQVGMSSPEVDLDGPTYSQGETLTVNGTEYTVTTVESEESEGETSYTGELTTFNESNVETATLENDSTNQIEGTYRVSVDDETNVSTATFVGQTNSSLTLSLTEGERVVYVSENVTATVDSVTPDGVTFRWSGSAMLANDSTVPYAGGEYRLRIQNGTNASTFTLVDEGNGTESVDGDPTFDEGDQFDYEPANVTATVGNVSAGNVTLGWTGTETLANGSTTELRDTYRVFIANNTNVSSADIVRERNVTNILRANDAVENSTLTRDNQEFVRFRDERTQALDTFLPPLANNSVGVGDEFYLGAENRTTTVVGFAATEMTVQWSNPANESIEFGEGENVTLAGENYFAHFPSGSSVQVLPADEYYGEYTATLSDIDYFETRQNGLWGIVIISLLAAIVLVTAAYLPTK